MGMNTFVEGFRPPDEEWKRMATIYNLCLKSKISVPEKVLAFFNDAPPHENGVLIDIGDCVEYFTEDVVQSWTVNITKLPEGIKHIKFTNSY